MSGKINNKTLLLVFAGLLGILAVTKLITSKKSVRTLDTELVQIDTSRITTVLLYPRAETGEEILFERNEGFWTVSNQEVTAPADQISIMRSILQLINLKTDRLVARSEDKWEEYKVADSLSTRIIVMEGKKKTLDLLIGRFEYNPPPGGAQRYPQNQYSGHSFVRKHSEPEVYAVEGFLGLSFNQTFNTWRDQAITNLEQAQISKLIFEYPADSGFIAQKSESGWLVAGLSADSSSMAGYLHDISRKVSSSFEDGFNPTAAPDYQLTIESENTNPVIIRAFKQPEGDVILNSSINPKSWFRSSLDDLFAVYFTPADRFLPAQ